MSSEVINPTVGPKRSKTEIAMPQCDDAGDTRPCQVSELQIVALTELATVLPLGAFVGSISDILDEE